MLKDKNTNRIASDESTSKIHKLARGYFADYKPESEHKDMVFVCKDKRMIYVNGVGYEGCGLVINIERIVPTIAEITGMADPKEGQIFFCLEDNRTYQYTSTGWHKPPIKRGDFINDKSQGDKMFFWNGTALDDTYNGITSYLLDNLNKVIYWYEGE